MKDKVLRSEVIQAAEKLCKALRNYSDSEMYLNLRIFTRDQTTLNNFEDSRDKELRERFGLPDYYSIKISIRDEKDSDAAISFTQIIGDASLAFYSEDEYGQEGIRTTLEVYKDGEEYE